MSSEKLSSLLDEMLEDSAIEQAAREVEAREAREAEQPAPVVEKPALEHILELTGLTEPDLRKVLGAAAPDDLLVVLAAGEEALQRRILRNLGPESVQWVRDNLAHMGEVNAHEAGAASAKVLKVANQLLADGKILPPAAESVGEDAAPRSAERGVQELIRDLVQIAKQSSPAALTELARSSEEPMLERGLAHVLEGQRGDALRSSLDQLREELEVRYAQRLRWMAEALVAISDGEDADAFAERTFKD